MSINIFCDHRAEAEGTLACSHVLKYLFNMLGNKTKDIHPITHHQSIWFRLA